MNWYHFYISELTVFWGLDFSDDIRLRHDLLQLNVTCYCNIFIIRLITAIFIVIDVESDLQPFPQLFIIQKLRKCNNIHKHMKEMWHKKNEQNRKSIFPYHRMLRHVKRLEKYIISSIASQALSSLGFTWQQKDLKSRRICRPPEFVTVDLTVPSWFHSRLKVM